MTTKNIPQSLMTPSTGGFLAAKLREGSREQKQNFKLNECYHLS